MFRSSPITAASNVITIEMTFATAGPEICVFIFMALLNHYNKGFSSFLFFFFFFLTSKHFVSTCHLFYSTNDDESDVVTESLNVYKNKIIPSYSHAQIRLLNLTVEKLMTMTMGNKLSLILLLRPLHHLRQSKKEQADRVFFFFFQKKTKRCDQPQTDQGRQCH